MNSFDFDALWWFFCGILMGMSYQKKRLLPRLVDWWYPLLGAVTLEALWFLAEGRGGVSMGLVALLGWSDPCKSEAESTGKGRG